MIEGRYLYFYSPKPPTLFPEQPSNTNKFKGIVLQKEGKRYLYTTEEGFHLYQVIRLVSRINTILLSSRDIREAQMSKEEIIDFLNEVDRYLKQQEENSEMYSLYLIAQKQFMQMYEERS